MPTTVLYFLDDPSRDKHFHSYVLSGLKRARYNPIVTYFWTGQSESKLEKLGHEILDLGCTRESYKGFHPGLVRKVMDVFKRTNAVAAHVQRHHPLTYVATASYLTQLPVLFYTIRITRTLRTFSRRMTFSLISRRITRVIAVSKGVKQEFVQRARIPGEMVEVVYNGLDPEQFRVQVDKRKARQAFDLPVDTFLFGMVARLRKAKDHSGLIRAFIRLQERNVSACLVLAGDGPLESELRDLVKMKGLEKHVIFLGRLPPENIPLLLKAFDVFVHPTWREGMPASVLEAMASGLPVIATDAEGVTDIFETDRSFGRILPRGDEEQLTQAMEALYRSTPEQRIQMGKEAQARVNEAFTHTHMVQRTVALYDRFLRPMGSEIN